MFSVKSKDGTTFEIEKSYDYKLHTTVFLITKNTGIMRTSKVYNIENMWWNINPFPSFARAFLYLKKNIDKLI